MLSRRDALVLAAAGVASAAVGGGAPHASAREEGLAAIAQRRGILFGASVGHEVADDAGYARLYVEEAQIVTTDTALKFDYLRPSEARFDFSGADAIMAFAAQRRLLVRGHNLAWNDNAPDWLKRLSAREVERVFDTHIDAVVSRYAGRLHSWDVVNEPFWPGHGKPGGYRDGPWFAAMGPDYVKRAFRRAGAIDKTARLCVNEAHCEIDNDWGRGIRPRLLRLVDELRDAGLPLHAVGLEGHLQPQWRYDDDLFLSFLAELAARDVDLYITELDVNDEAFPAETAARDAAVAARYETFLTRVLQQPRVRVVITWQLSDRYTWYRSIARSGEDATRLPRPLPFDDALQRKPAWGAIARALNRRTA
ncbi:MAG: endo-1,4-beta-xylanase [Methylobacteriaceae bacterium]|nr:endo-1,4-beta-xylanase [Methylobacteriaceae bacterium]